MLKFCVAQSRCLLLDAAEKIQLHPVRQQLGLAFDGGSLTVLQAVTEVLESKRKGNRSAVYLKSLQHYLARFATGREQVEIVAVATDDVEKFLEQFTASYSRQTWLNRISTLFSYAVRRGYIPSNPCDRVERVTIDHKPPVIVTVEQSRQLLAVCPAVCRPWLILAMFAGVRPDGELMKLHWSKINLDTATVTIDFPKVRSHRRIVPLEPLAVKLLRECPLKTGMVAPSRSTLRRFKRKIRTLLVLARYPTDLLRHTAASFLQALHQNAAKVAGWLGNSVKILMSHYVEPVSALDCAAFWTR